MMKRFSQTRYMVDFASAAVDAIAHITKST